MILFNILLVNIVLFEFSNAFEIELPQIYLLNPSVQAFNQYIAQSILIPNNKKDDFPFDLNPNSYDIQTLSKLFSTTLIKNKNKNNSSENHKHSINIISEKTLNWLKHVNYNKIYWFKAFKSIYKRALKIINPRTNISYSVMDKQYAAKRANGDKHFFYSLAPYYWPNTTLISPLNPQELPWVRMDDFINPVIYNITDAQYFIRMVNCVKWLSTAAFYFFPHKPKNFFSEYAMKLIKIWFLNEDTLMYPNMQYSHVVPGAYEYESYLGIIQLRELTRLIDSFGLLAKFDGMTLINHGMKNWFKDYLLWLSNSGRGVQLYDSENNHHTWYNAQIISLQLYLGNLKIIKNILFDTRTLISRQIDVNGLQSLEVERKNSWHYSCFNLEAYGRLGIIAKHLNEYSGLTNINEVHLKSLISIHDMNDNIQTNFPTIFNIIRFSNISWISAVNTLINHLPINIFPIDLQSKFPNTANQSWNYTQIIPRKLNDIIPLLRAASEAYDFQDDYNRLIGNLIYPIKYYVLADILKPLNPSSSQWLLLTPPFNIIPNRANNSKFHSSWKKNQLPFFLPLGIMGAYRWLVFCIKALTGGIFLLKQNYIRRYFKSSNYIPERDVTIVVPTIDQGSELNDAIVSWLRNRPKQIILVTLGTNVPILKSLISQIEENFREKQELVKKNLNTQNNNSETTMEYLNTNSFDLHLKYETFQTNMIILSVDVPNKRSQMITGLIRTETEFVVFADDDAIWPDNCLVRMIACFDNPNIGGVGTEQRMRPNDLIKGPNFWEVLSDLRLTAKTLENASCLLLGTGVTCLSGRTAMYRTCIFKPNQNNGPYSPNMFGADSKGFLPDMYNETSEYCRKLLDQKEQKKLLTLKQLFPVVKTLAHDSDDAYIVNELVLSSNNFSIAESPPILASKTLVSTKVCYLLFTDMSFQFLNEYWHGLFYGSSHLHSGDDKFLTRFITARGWDMYIQFGPDARIQTTFKADWTFLKQYMRWTRNTWRSDWRSIVLERSLWRRRSTWYIILIMLDKCLSPLTLLVGLCLVVSLCIQTEIGEYRLSVMNILVSYICWILISRFIKFFPHWISRASHLIYLPFFILSQYILAILKIYCLFTLHNTEWSTRKSADAFIMYKQLKKKIKRNVILFQDNYNKYYL
ncbi:unnamed protein product [Rotaria sp. Silwood2]|nr:unnamed protein product [Rotaria sp. Silwood2]CAF4418749.1 unnamed protein product [Rotaria sp. Silwood2]